MQDIKVGRYSAEGVTVDGEHTPGAGEFFGGWIEPEDQGWIIFLEPDGTPAVFWGTRTEAGACVGEGVKLTA